MELQVRALVPLARVIWSVLLVVAVGVPSELVAESVWAPRGEPISVLPEVAPVRLVSVLQAEDDEDFDVEAIAASAEEFGAAENPPEPAEEEAEKDVDDYAEEPLGEAPEDNSLLFLRRATPLLDPGAFAIDYGLRYTFRETQGFSAINANGQTILLPGRTRTRALTHPVGIRYGLNSRTQLFANVPAGLAINDRADLLRQEATSVYGMGDISFGFSRLLRNGNAYCPSVIAGFNVSAPTGAHPFENSPGSAALGSGFWGVGGNLFMVQQYDPAVVFGGLAYNHQFDAEYFGTTLDPGELVAWSLGAGLAVNSDVTFTTIFQGSYQAKLRSNRTSVPNSASEPMSLRFALVLSRCKHRILEPFVAVGLTPDAPNVDLGIVITRQ